MPCGVALEYSYNVTPQGLVSIPNVAIPDSVYGMTAALAMHQTLLADACYTGDPHDLHKALLAFPYKSDTAEAHELWCKLVLASRDIIAPSFMELPKLL